MLKVQFEAETSSDYITPLTVANAILESDIFEIEDIEEIAEHLATSVKYHKEFANRLKEADTLER